MGKKCMIGLQTMLRKGGQLKQYLTQTLFMTLLELIGHLSLSISVLLETKVDYRFENSSIRFTSLPLGKDMLDY